MERRILLLLLHTITTTPFLFNLCVSLVAQRTYRFIIENKIIKIIRQDAVRLVAYLTPLYMRVVHMLACKKCVALFIIIIGMRGLGMSARRGRGEVLAVHNLFFYYVFQRTPPKSHSVI